MNTPTLKGQSLSAWRTWLEENNQLDFNPKDPDAKNQVRYVCEAFLELITWLQKQQQ